MRALVQADLPAQPYDVPIFYPGVPSGSAVLLDLEFVRTVVFPANFAGSAFKARVAATSSTAIDVQKNGSTVGTITFAAGATSATFTTTSGAAVTFNLGDYMSLVCPSVADATLANLRGALTGTR
jgi:hypothetical protein